MTTQTLTLTDFLLARITEDEAVARDATSLGGGSIYADRNMYGTKLLAHVRRHNPARVLAECEAMKSIVAECRALIDSFGDWDADPDAVVMWPDVNRRERSQARGRLHTLATIYADHPDYRDEWAV